MQVLPCARGHDKIAYEGYVYARDRERADHVTWRCIQKGCQGRAFTPTNFQHWIGHCVVTVTQEHSNHGPDHAFIEIELAKSKVLEIALTPEPTTTIVKKIIETLSPEAQVRVGDGHQFRKIVSRHRVKNNCLYSRLPPVGVNQDEEVVFEVDQRFPTYEDLKETFERFRDRYCHPFVIGCHSQRQVMFRCSHGIYRKSSSTGKRPNQHYFYTGCQAKVNAFKDMKSRGNPWRITKMVLEHNHPLGQSASARFYGQTSRKTSSVGDENRHHQHHHRIGLEDNSNHTMDLDDDDDEEEDDDDDDAGGDSDGSIQEVDPRSHVEARVHAGHLPVNAPVAGNDSGASNGTNNNGTDPLVAAAAAGNRDLSQREKFDILYFKLRAIIDIICEYDTPTFMDYYQQLQVILENAQTHRPLLHRSRNSRSSRGGGGKRRGGGRQPAASAVRRPVTTIGTPITSHNTRANSSNNAIPFAPNTTLITGTSGPVIQPKEEIP